ncbi:MAG: methylenetetrahydrofolate reductase [Candidatus Firestonebacteria bacterium]
MEKAGSNLEKLLAKKEFVVTGELGPAKGADAEQVKKIGELLRGYVDAINITDNQTAIVRLSSIAAGVILTQMGLEPVIQIVCRDRNRIAIQSDVLGAAALGIKNILCLTGDHQKFGNHPEAKGVFDLDSVQLIALLKKMRDDKQFASGEEIKVPPKIFLGAAENPYADPFEFRTNRLAKKISAGAEFIQTQAVFDVPKFAKWMEEIRKKGLDQKVAILPGLIPMKSARMAQYMKDNVPGVSVPQEFVDRMLKAKETKTEKEEGVKICIELIHQVKKIEGVRGIHLMAVAWEEIVPKIIEGAGLLPRPLP